MTLSSEPHRRDEVVQRDNPLGQIWSKITSDIGGIFTVDAASTTRPAPTPLPPPGNASPAEDSTIMTTELLTTVWRTSLVTVKLTTDVVESATEQISQPAATGNGPQSTATGHAPPATSIAVSSSTRTTLATSTRHSLSRPTTDVPTARNPTMTMSLFTHDPITTPTITPTPAPSKHDPHQKQAIIGGLAGAIGGLILIGLLICLCLRRRRKEDDDGESPSEKAIHSQMAPVWSEFTQRDSHPNPVLPVSQGTDTPDYDGGLLRVSLDRWPRPYANGQSYRESLGPRRLQVMNPSPSRPSTPVTRGSTDSIPRFLVRQKTALAAVFSNAPGSRAGSTGESPHRALPVPTIAVDPALSTECIPRTAPPTPSFRSYSSVTSLPIVSQRPPEDPFLTPPDERLEDGQLPSAGSSRRPGITPLQSAAGAAGRTLSHLGSALNPFKTKSHLGPSNLAASVSSGSRRSVSTFSSGGDPFQYDRPSIRESNAGGRGEVERPNWEVYEGT